MWYKNVDTGFFRFVTMNAYARQTDRWTEGQKGLGNNVRCIMQSHGKAEYRVRNNRKVWHCGTISNAWAHEESRPTAYGLGPWPIVSILLNVIIVAVVSNHGSEAPLHWNRRATVSIGSTVFVSVDGVLCRINANFDYMLENHTLSYIYDYPIHQRMAWPGHQEDTERCMQTDIKTKLCVFW